MTDSLCRRVGRSGRWFHPMRGQEGDCRSCANLCAYWGKRPKAANLLGLAGAVELSSIAGAPGKRAYDIFLDCYNKGVLVRAAGENLVLCPPYIVEKEHIDKMVNVLADSIRKHA